MWEQDQTDLPNESLAGNLPTPVPMFFGTGVCVSGARDVVTQKTTSP
jgi:hypothetical protein